MDEDGGAETGRGTLFSQIRQSPTILDGATRAVVADVVRGGEVRFVTVQGGTVLLDMLELIQSLPKGADVGMIRVN